MGVGNERTEGAKGNNFDWQHRVLIGLQALKDIFTSASNQQASKIRRIKGAADYTMDITYEGTTGTENPITVVYTGTTYLGVEIITSTITYVDETINGSNIIKVQYS